MKACILINAFLRGEEDLYQPRRIREELVKLGVEADVRTPGNMPVYVDRGEIVNALDGYDFYIYLDKDKYILDALNRTGKLVFNSARAIELCDDKMSTYMALAGSGVPLVKTVPGLLCFDGNAKIEESSIERIESLIPYPIVVKEAYGSQGKGVFLANNRAELAAIAECVKCKPHLFQRFVAESRGRDLRVIVLGGKVLGGMLRRAESEDFRSNVGAGGSGVAYEPSEEQATAAIKAARALGLDYCGVDLLFGGSGALVCEVNSNAFFRAFESATGINVAAAYARYTVEKAMAARK